MGSIGDRNRNLFIGDTKAIMGYCKRHGDYPDYLLGCSACALLDAFDQGMLSRAMPAQQRVPKFRRVVVCRYCAQDWLEDQQRCKVRIFANCDPTVIVEPVE